MNDKTGEELADYIKNKIFSMLFECYPKDMENFDTMTHDQAYRLLQMFWEKVEKIK